MKLRLPEQLTRLLPTAEQGLTVLSIDGRWLKLVQGAGRSSSRTALCLLALPIEGLTEEQVVAALKIGAQQAGIAPRAVLVANPAHLTTTRVFNLPSTDSAEIREIVTLQAEKHTPYTKEEILTDFQILDTDRGGYSRVLLVLSHQDIVHRALRVVEGMGWPLERVGFELEGLLGWFLTTKPQAPDGLILIADIDAETTTLLAVKDRRLHFHRSVAIGAAQLAREGAEGPAKLLAEFQRSIEAFEAEGTNLPVAGVVLTGAAEQFADLKDRLHQGLDLPVSAVSSLAGVTTTGAAADSKLPEGVSFASLLGLAWEPGSVDLTPKALRLHRAFEARAKALFGVACQVIGCLLLVSCLIIGKAIQNQRHYARLFVEHQMLGEEVTAMESRMDQVAVVQTWLTSRAELLEAIAAMSQRTPSAIEWDTLTYTSGDQIALKGISEEIPKVYDFAAELRNAGLFSKVEARRVAKRKINDRDVTEFELVCVLRPAEGAEDVDKANPGS